MHGTIRQATLEDVPLLVAHRRRMWEDMAEGFSTQALDDADVVYDAWLRVEMPAGRLIAFVGEEGTTLGSGCVWLQTIHPRPQAMTVQPYVLSMYVEPARRGQGWARRLLEAITDWCSRHGHAGVVLHASPAGRELYLRAGFERTWEMRRVLRPLDEAK